MKEREIQREFGKVTITNLCLSFDYSYLHDSKYTYCMWDVFAWEAPPWAIMYVSVSAFHYNWWFGWLWASHQTIKSVTQCPQLSVSCQLWTLLPCTVPAKVKACMKSNFACGLPGLISWDISRIDLRLLIERLSIFSSKCVRHWAGSARGQAAESSVYTVLFSLENQWPTYRLLKPGLEPETTPGTSWFSST